MTGAGVRCAAFTALLTLALLGVARAARGASALVALIPAAGASPAAELVLNRTRGELLADGFHVVVVDPTPEPQRAAMVARVGREAGAAITVGVALDGDGTTLTLVFVDGVSGRAVMRRMEEREAVGGQAPEVIARHHVDRLRATLLDFLVENAPSTAPPPAPRPPPPAPKPAVTAPPPPAEAAPAPKPAPRFALEAGLGVLGGFEGVGPAVMPIVRARYELRPSVHLRVTGAWLGTQPRVESAAGSATIDQGLAVLEVLAQVGPGRPVRPLFSLGAGLYHADITGSGAPPNGGTHASDFAFALDGGAGVVARIAPHIEWALEAHAVVTAPGVAIRFLDADVARVSRPSVLGTMSLTGWI